MNQGKQPVLAFRGQPSHRGLDLDAASVFPDERRFVAKRHVAAAHPGGELFRQPLAILRWGQLDQRFQCRELGRVVAGEGLVGDVGGDIAAVLGDDEAFANVADRLEQRCLALGLECEVAIEEVLAEVSQDREDEEGEAPGHQLGGTRVGHPQPEACRGQDHHGDERGDGGQQARPPTQPAILVGPTGYRVKFGRNPARRAGAGFRRGRLRIAGQLDHDNGRTRASGRWTCPTGLRPAPPVTCSFWSAGAGERCA